MSELKIQELKLNCQEDSIAAFNNLSKALFVFPKSVESKKILVTSGSRIISQFKSQRFKISGYQKKPIAKKQEIISPKSDKDNSKKKDESIEKRKLGYILFNNDRIKVTNDSSTELVYSIKPSFDPINSSIANKAFVANDKLSYEFNLNTIIENYETKAKFYPNQNSLSAIDNESKPFYLDPDSKTFKSRGGFSSNIYPNCKAAQQVSEKIDYMDIGNKQYIFKESLFNNKQIEILSSGKNVLIAGSPVACNVNAKRVLSLASTNHPTTLKSSNILSKPKKQKELLIKTSKPYMKDTISTEEEKSKMDATITDRINDKVNLMTNDEIKFEKYKRRLSRGAINTDTVDNHYQPQLTDIDNKLHKIRNTYEMKKEMENLKKSGIYVGPRPKELTFTDKEKDRLNENIQKEFIRLDQINTKIEKLFDQAKKDFNHDYTLYSPLIDANDELGLKRDNESEIGKNNLSVQVATNIQDIKDKLYLNQKDYENIKRFL